MVLGLQWQREHACVTVWGRCGTFVSCDGGKLLRGLKSPFGCSRGGLYVSCTMNYASRWEGVGFCWRT